MICYDVLHVLLALTIESLSFSSYTKRVCIILYYYKVCILFMVSLLEESGQVFIATPGPGKSPRLGAEGGGHDGP